MTIAGDHIVVRNLKDAVRSVAEPGIRVMNRRAMAFAVEGVFFDATRDRFATRGFNRWPPLSAKTIRRHGDHRVLHLSGALYGSLMSQAALKVDPQGFRYGTSVYYARFHHKGVGVPRRTVVGLTRAGRNDAKEAIRDYIVRGI